MAYIFIQFKQPNIRERAKYTSKEKFVVVFVPVKHVLGQLDYLFSVLLNVTCV
jgi:hypothetical protein